MKTFSPMRRLLRPCWQSQLWSFSWQSQLWSFSWQSQLWISGFLLLGTCSYLTAAELDFRSQAFTLPSELESLIIADTNGDGLNELIGVIDTRVRVYFQDETGFDFDEGFSEINLPGQSIGWDISSNYSEDGSASVIALIDGRDFLIWHIDNQTIAEPVVVESDLPGFLSKGVNRLHFSRDITGDGRQDLIIPGAGVLNLLVDGGDGEYQAPLAVQSDIRIRTNLNADQLERRTGQEINIPNLRLRDVNSDGATDLVSRTAERIDVFLASNSGDHYFPNSPSYSVDRAAIEERLGLNDLDFESVDFSNLTGLLALTHEELMEDVDGDGIEDLLLREGGKVSLFIGHKDGMDLDQPRQVLRSGGNVLTTFLYDENEDELKDLWLWRVESISIGDIFVWLALSGTVTVEAFVYPNDGERFARRPTRKLSVDIKFPSVIRLASTVLDLVEEAEAAENQQVVPTATANLDDFLDMDDLLVLVDNQLQIFLNSIEPPEELPDFLGVFDYSRDRDDYEINVRDLLNSISISGNPHLDKIGDRSFDETIQLNTSVVEGDIITAQLNNDGLDDVFVFSNYDSSHIQGLLLLSQ